MKILGIACSPREGGNTEILVREALQGAQEAGAETKLVLVAGKDIGRAVVKTVKMVSS
jgi:multimeric flavodoxin WrbA